MSPISFDSGITGVSRVNSALIDTDFPKSKASFKPSGENVIAHFWKALDMGKTFQNRELKFATNFAEQNNALSPEEHHMMTDMALTILQRHENEGPEIKKALAVFRESKELQEFLLMSRNILLAG